MKLNPWLLIPSALALALPAACAKTATDTSAPPAAQPEPAAAGSAHAQSTTPGVHVEAVPPSVPKDDRERARLAAQITAPPGGWENLEAHRDEPGAGGGGVGAPVSKDILALGSNDRAKVIASNAGPGGTVAESESYTVKVSAPAKVPKGAEGVVTVDLVPKKGWKLNREFPTKLQVTAPDGVAVKKGEQVLADATSWTEAAGQFSVRFTASAAGKADFAGKFKFAVCTDTTCDPKKEELAWSVAIE